MDEPNKSEALEESFGAQKVSPVERERKIRHVFKVVAPRYDLMNDFMSFGIHRLWKAYLINRFNISEQLVVLDLAGGTGDIALGIAKKQHQVMILDPSLEMMQEGKRRHQITSIAGVGEQLPLPDNSVDAVTISFGIRNMTNMQKAMAEIYRVLKPQGVFYCLEFSKPMALIRPFYNLYNRFVIPRLGALVAGQPSAYQYLIESIRRFPDQQEMKALIHQAGFERVDIRNLSFGIACVHSGFKQ